MVIVHINYANIPNVFRHQEFLFSRRRLIFTPRVLIYQCRKAFWREDVELEKYKGELHREDTLTSSVLDLGDTVDLIDMRAPDIFEMLVRDYSQRNFTYSVDALNGINGILSSLEASFECQFHYGLPTCVFDWALPFLYLEPPPPEYRRPEFPSWTWVGRRGEVFYFAERLTDTWLNHHTWIVWYCRHENTGVIELLRPKQMDPLKRPRWNKRLNTTGDVVTDRYFVANSDQIAPTQYVYQHEETLSKFQGTLINKAKLLQFWTVWVQFRCYRRPNATELDFGIYGQDGSEVGNVNFFKNAMFTTSPDPETLREFIIIYGKGDSWIHVSPPKGSDLKGYTKEKVCNQGYIALLIEWQTSRSGFVFAVRMAVANLNQDALQNSFEPGPMWKEIILG